MSGRSSYELCLHWAACGVYGRGESVVTQVREYNGYGISEWIDSIWWRGDEEENGEVEGR